MVAAAATQAGHVMTRVRTCCWMVICSLLYLRQSQSARLHLQPEHRMVLVSRSGYMIILRRTWQRTQRSGTCADNNINSNNYLSNMRKVVYGPRHLVRRGRQGECAS